MHRVGYDGRAVGQPAADKLDKSKADIDKERHADAAGALVIALMVLRPVHKRPAFQANALSRPAGCKTTELTIRTPFYCAHQLTLLSQMMLPGGGA